MRNRSGSRKFRNRALGSAEFGTFFSPLPRAALSSTEPAAELVCGTPASASSTFLPSPKAHPLVPMRRRLSISSAGASTLAVLALFALARMSRRRSISASTTTGAPAASATSARAASARGARARLPRSLAIFLARDATTPHLIARDQPSSAPPLVTTSTPPRPDTQITHPREQLRGAAAAIIAACSRTSRPAHPLPHPLSPLFNLLSMAA